MTVRLAALQLLAEYTEALDSRDADRLVALLDDDVHLTRGEETFVGRQAFLDAYRGFLESPLLGSRHRTANHRFLAQTDDRVTVRSSFEATFFEEHSTRTVIGTYEDDLALVSGAWRFTHKRNRLEWSYEMPPAVRS